MKTKRVLVVLALLAGCEYEGGLLGEIEAEPWASPERLEFVEAEGTGAVAPQEITLGNDGDQAAEFALEDDASWLALSTYSCTSAGPEDDIIVQVTPDLTGLAPGVYLATIWARCGEWQKAVGVQLAVAPAGTNIVYVSLDRGNDSTGDGSFASPYRTVSKGVSALSPAAMIDTVYVLPSETAYGEREAFPIEIVDGGSVTAAGPEHVEISGGGWDRVFSATSGQACTLSGLTVSEGGATFGGGLLVTNASSVTVTDCVFVECTAAGNGGAVDIESGCAVIFSQCVFRLNGAGGEGGAAHDAAGSVFDDCVFESNTATNEGGAFFGTGGQLTDCFFTGNSTAGNGGAFFAGGAVTLTGTTFLANTAGGSGGGCYLAAGGTLDTCTLDSNQATVSGGGAYCVGSPRVTDCLLTNNSSQGDGGGLYLLGAPVGPIGQPARLHDSSLLYNSAGTGSKGGGLFLGGDVAADVLRNVFAHNSAAEGGGVHVERGSLVPATGGQFRNNLVHHNTGGFSIALGAADVWNCTFVDNSTYGLKRIGAGAVTLDVMNSIFWQNEDDLDRVPDGSITYCDVGVGDGSDPTNIHTDPTFANPQGEDYHLRPSSPCVDAGYNFLLSAFDRDLDDNGRQTDGDGDSTATVDMGCYEYQP